jgi:glycosyltransferase involved in cell wall biosynthesis
MRRIVTISYTPLDAPGGVPRWNRDIRDAFPDRDVIHYSWDDLVDHAGINSSMPEWEKARVLNGWLIASRKVKFDDIILVDGFWGIGFVGTKFNVISVAHGNWSHTTLEDVKKGVQPEFPQHSAVQIDYRRRHLKSGGKIVAVSEFIAHQNKIQWGFDMEVINNGIDLNRFKPAEIKLPRNRPIIIHGTTTANKGFDHIEAVKKFDADVWLLDEAAHKLKLPKYEALAQADLFVHPSAHEGNSYMVLETLASGVPIVAYDVGLLFEIASKQHKALSDVMCPNGTAGGSQAGIIMLRSERSPEETLSAVKEFFRLPYACGPIYDPRSWAWNYRIERFRKEWREYIERYENDFGKS